MIAPILHEFTYQAMVADLLDLEDGCKIQYGPHLYSTLDSYISLVYVGKKKAHRLFSTKAINYGYEILDILF
jgi:hypothetical protein